MRFLKSVLAVFVGVALFSLVTFIIFSMIIVAASKEQPVDVSENTVLYLKLDKPITERETSDPFAGMIPISALGENIGLIELRRAIEHAKSDENIEGIFLEIPYLAAGISSTSEIRDMLEDFKTSGKFVVAYSDYYTEGAYYLASVADEVYMAKDFGLVEFNGLSAERIYLKGTMEKLGVQPIVFKAGRYKSYGEMYSESEMTEAEEEQVSAYVNSIYNTLLGEIAESRNLSIGQLKNIADSMLVREETDAVKYQLVDQVAYQNEVIDIMKEKLGLEKDKDLNLISHSKYNKSFVDDYSSRNVVGVLIATGTIVSGEGTAENISSEKFTKELKKLRENDRVKAVVLRVNSPGGSALASDLIWNEVKLTAQKKPVIASMSDVAASGGYYISMAADTIVAMPGTITGSIGVVGVFFSLNDLLNEKLGVTTDNYKTGKYSDLGNIARPMSPDEQQIVQNMVDDSYRIFAGKAAKDRNMEYDELHEVAQGRVWTGEDALKIGLVDLEGDLEYAIKIASEKAGIADDYRVKYYPEQKPFIEQLLTELETTQASWVSEHFKEAKPYLKPLLEIEERKGIQARLPYDLNIGF